jgi:membrane protease YdiL (CAAX protease family)
MKKETKNLVIFLVATFVWTWAWYAPIAAGHHTPYEMPWTIFLILGGMGPSLVGVIMILLRHDKQERLDYWRRCFSLRRIGGFWWLVIFLIFPVLFGLSIAVDLLFGGSLPGMDQLRSLIANPVTIPLAAFISFMSGPWSEEFGWRGYALDRMIKSLGILRGSIVLGLIWGVWHLPLFLMSGNWHSEIGLGLTGFWTFTLHSAGLGLIMTWVYLKTNRSILSGMLMHFTSNFCGQLLAPSSTRFEVISMILMLVLGLALCTSLKQQEPESIPSVQPAPSH